MSITAFDIAEHLETDADIQAFLHEVAITGDASDFIHALSKRPRKAKVSASFFDADVLNAFKATGLGWQTRMNDALKEWLKEHSAA